MVSQKKEQSLRMNWKENGLIVKIISSTILQSFVGFKYSPRDAIFRLNIVLKLNGHMYEKWTAELSKQLRINIVLSTNSKLAVFQLSTPHSNCLHSVFLMLSQILMQKFSRRNFHLLISKHSFQNCWTEFHWSFNGKAVKLLLGYQQSWMNTWKIRVQQH